jgi:hypothetical protein
MTGVVDFADGRCCQVLRLPTKGATEFGGGPGAIVITVTIPRQEIMIASPGDMRSLKGVRAPPFSSIGRVNN